MEGKAYCMISIKRDTQNVIVKDGSQILIYSKNIFLSQNLDPLLVLLTLLMMKVRIREIIQVSRPSVGWIEDLTPMEDTSKFCKQNYVISAC